MRTSPDDHPPTASSEPSDVDGCDPRRLGERDRNALDALEALVSRRLQYIGVTQQFAEIANRSESLEEGISGALDCFCRGLGWPLGHAFIEADADPDRYLDSGVWWIEPGLDGDAFVEASRGEWAEADGGLVGAVIESASAQWAGREVTDLLGKRSAAGRAMGLKCGIAFPIRVQSRVAGVLEFFSHDDVVCERELLDAVAQLGTQLGRVVEREEFEREIARTAQDERRRLGRELHDTLSQQLAGIGMLARSLERKLEGEGNAEAARAHHLVQTIRDAGEQLRAVARGLNPVDVDAGTLSHAAAAFLKDTEQAFGVRCTFDEAHPLGVEDDFEANQLFCIIREAVHNAAKHAEANAITVEATQGPDNVVELCVKDDGKGFDPSAVENGMGLRTLRYRARIMGARLRIESAPQQGTSVVCTFRRGRHRD